MDFKFPSLVSPIYSSRRPDFPFAISSLSSRLHQRPTPSQRVPWPLDHCRWKILGWLFHFFCIINYFIFGMIISINFIFLRTIEDLFGTTISCDFHITASETTNLWGCNMPLPSWLFFRAQMVDAEMVGSLTKTRVQCQWKSGMAAGCAISICKALAYGMIPQTRVRLWFVQFPVKVLVAFLREGFWTWDRRDVCTWLPFCTAFMSSLNGLGLFKKSAPKHPHTHTHKHSVCYCW